MIYVGTSGYRYKDWRGTFYPRSLPQQDELRYYAERFPAVELNFTYYGIPKPSVIAGMVVRTPPEFRFCIKANQATTHEQDRSVLGAFKDAIAPAAEAGQLASVLAQFPFSFKNQEDNRRYLHQLAQDLQDYRPVVEFRHNSWVCPQVFQFLRANGLAYCCVDEPELPGLLPPDACATSDTAYVRFHSRDAAKWYAGAAARYDYLYSKDELAEWVPKTQHLAEQAEDVYIFFNNCHAGSAAVNAAEFQEMLAELGLL